MRKPIRFGFTLIELLIVVAIIAILAAIAVPNFLEAQTRSKVSRTLADMRSAATAIEAYYIDYNSYPPCNTFGTALRIAPFGGGADANYPVLEVLSTPVAYLTTALVKDPFLLKFRKSAATAAGMATAPVSKVNPAVDAAGHYNSYIYQAVNGEGRAMWIADSFSSVSTPLKAHGWFMHSCGPDSMYYNLGGVLDGDYDDAGTISMMYDPTNGTISEGSIWRAGGSSPASANSAAGIGLRKAIQRTGR